MAFEITPEMQERLDSAQRMGVTVEEPKSEVISASSEALHKKATADAQEVTSEGKVKSEDAFVEFESSYFDEQPFRLQISRDLEKAQLSKDAAKLRSWLLGPKDMSKLPEFMADAESMKELLPFVTDLDTTEVSEEAQDTRVIGTSTTSVVPKQAIDPKYGLTGNVGKRVWFNTDEQSQKLADELNGRIFAEVYLNWVTQGYSPDVVQYALSRGEDISNYEAYRGQPFEPPIEEKNLLEEIAFDIATGVIAGKAVRKGLQKYASQVPGFDIGKRYDYLVWLGAAESFATGRGISMVADAYASDPDTPALKAALGTIGFGAFLGLSRAGLVNILTNAKLVNKPLYNMMSEIAAHQKGRLAQAIGAAMSDVEASAFRKLAASPSLTAAEPMNTLLTDTIVKATKAPGVDSQLVKKTTLDIVKGIENPTPYTDNALVALGIPKDQQAAFYAAMAEDPVNKVLTEAITPMLTDSLGISVRNSAELGGTLGKEVLYDVVNNRQMAVAGINRTILNYDDDTWDVTGRIQIKPGASTSNWVDHSLSSQRYNLKEVAPGAVEESVNELFKAWRMQRGYREAQKSVRQGLGSNARQQFEEAVAHEDQVGRLALSSAGLIDDTGRVVVSDPNAIDAVYANRMLMDNFYSILNDSFKHRLMTRGVQVLEGHSANADMPYILVEKTKPGPRKVDITGKSWTTKLDETGEEISLADLGYEAYTLRDPESLLSISAEGKEAGVLFLHPDDAAKFVKDISPEHNLVNYVEGYATRVYKDPFHVYRMSVDSETGAVSVGRFATAPTVKKAVDFIGKIEAKETEKYFAARRNVNLTEIETSPVFKQFFDGATKAQKDKITAALQEAGFTYDEVNAIAMQPQLTKVRDPVKQSVYAKERTAGLISTETGKSAAMMPSIETQQRYFDSVLRYGTTEQIADEMLLKIEAEYAKVPIVQNLMNKYGFKKVRDLARDDDAWRGVSKETKGVKKELEQLLRQVDTLTAKQSTAEIAEKRWFEGMADKLYTTKVYKGMAKSPVIGDYLDRGATFMLERLTLSGVSRGARTLTAVKALGLFNVAQLYTQFSSSLNAFAHLHSWGNTKHVAGGIGDLFSAMLYGRFAKTIGVNEDKGAVNLLRELEESGFVAGEDFVDLAHVYLGNIGTRAKLAHLADYNMWFFKEGNRLQRASVWFTERRMLNEEIAEGTHSLKVTDIGTQKYYREINKRADRLAINMTSLDSANILRANAEVTTPGELIVDETKRWLTQFKSFSVKQAELFFGKKLSNAEKIAMTAAWGSLYGTKGIPFAMDALASSELAYAFLNDDPSAVGKVERKVIGELVQEQYDFLLKASRDKPYLSSLGIKPEEAERAKEFMERALIKGGIAAVTENNLDLATRFSISSVFDVYNRYTDKKDHWYDINAPAWQTILQIKRSVDAGRSFLELSREIGWNMLPNEPRAIGLAKTAAAVVPQAANIVKAYEASTTGGFRNMQGQLLSEKQPGLHEIILQAVGVAPGDINDQIEFSKLKRIQEMFLSDYVKTQTRELAKLPPDSELFNKKREEFITTLQEINPMAISQAISDLLFEIQMKDVPASDVEAMRTLRQLKQGRIPLESGTEFLNQ